MRASCCASCRCVVGRLCKSLAQLVLPPDTLGKSCALRLPATPPKTLQWHLSMSSQALQASLAPAPPCRCRQRRRQAAAMTSLAPCAGLAPAPSGMGSTLTALRQQRAGSSSSGRLGVAPRPTTTAAASLAAAAADGGDAQPASSSGSFLRIVLPTALALLVCNMDRICLRCG